MNEQKQQQNTRDWDSSEFTKHIRIKPKKHKYIDKTKWPHRTMAGKLDEIIDFYIDNH